MRHLQFLAILLICLAASSVLRAADDVKIVPDVVYGHKFGLALTFDVFQPQDNANGAGVLFIVSGGWYSSWQPPEKAQGAFKPLTDKGFTVFAVRHGSSPKFGQHVGARSDPTTLNQVAFGTKMWFLVFGFFNHRSRKTR